MWRLSYQGSEEDDTKRSHEEQTSQHKLNNTTSRHEDSGLSPEDLEATRSLLNDKKKENNKTADLFSITSTDSQPTSQDNATN